MLNLSCNLSTVGQMNADQYCLQSVKNYDYENFLSCLLLPDRCRGDIVALRAFNIELAQVGVTTTREPLAGLMRLQFWRDTLTAVHEGRSPQQPVAQLLHRAVQRHGLQKRWLRQLIESREQLIHSPGFDTVEQVEAYAEASNSALYYLTLQAAGVQSMEADHCASHLGKSEGIVRLLRGVSFLAGKKQIMLPRQLMAEHGVSEEDVFRRCQEQKLQDVVFTLASLANQHIEHARDLSREVSRDALLVLLPVVATASALRRLQRVNFDVFHPQLAQRDGWLPAALWWARFKRRL